MLGELRAGFLKGRKAADNELLLQEFDGWYYHANDLGAVWNSLYEDFETYYERHPTACLLIGDQPHANIDHLRKNLASLLKQEAV